MTRAPLALIALAGLAMAPSRAVADDDAPETITVEVGKTVSREVGYAMGHLCDDETIVHAEMQNGTPDNNLFVVTGLKAGTTMCRAGTVQNRPQILFQVTVIAPKPAPAPKKPAKPAKPAR
jgi:hypothetical protein